MKFAATFIPGLGEIVLRHLKSYTREEMEVTYVEDGLIVGVTSLPAEKLREMRHWNNAFIVVAEAQEVASVDAVVSHLTKAALQKARAHLPGIQSIQMRIMDKNQPVAMASQRRKIFERQLAALGLQTVRQHANIELWVMRRASGYGLIGLRLPRLRFKRQERSAGELRPELVNLMALAAGVTSNDTVLDPFAGHGAIPRELIAGFSPKRVIALEQDPKLAGKIRALAKDKPSLTVIPGDALAMQELKDMSVNRIVTDPPWGKFAAATMPLSEFYERMLGEFMRVLRPGGVAVVLCGAKEELDAALATSPLDLVKRYEVLVSGKKASLVKLRRPSGV